MLSVPEQNFGGDGTEKTEFHWNFWNFLLIALETPPARMEERSVVGLGLILYAGERLHSPYPSS